MEKGDDPYEILGVGYDATEDEIKKVYRKLALKHHPDRHLEEEDKEKAHDVFAKISAAYDVLTDPVKRYDWKQANEDKMNGSKAAAGGGYKNTAPNGPIRRQSTAPMTRPKTTPTNKPRPRSTSPKPSKTAKHPPSSGASVSSQRKSTAAPPPGGAFSWARSNQPNPHSQHPGNKAKDDGSVKSRRSTAARSTASAPPTSYSNTPGMKETAGGPRPTMWSRKSTPPNNDTSYSATPHSREEFTSPSVKPKNKVTPAATRASMYSSSPAVGKKENPHQPVTSYSLSGTNGKPVERTYSPLSKSAKTVPKSRVGIGLSAAPNLDDSDHFQKDGRRASLQPGTHSGNGLRRPNSFVAPTSKRSSSHSPGPGTRRTVEVKGASSGDSNEFKSPRGGKRASVPYANAHFNDSVSKGGKTPSVHDVLETFEKIMKQEFPEDYWERDWKKKGMFTGNKRVIQSKSTNFNPHNKKLVVSMTTSTKKEKRSDNPKLVDLKTVTKVLRNDGSVEKYTQASVIDKEEAKKVDADTITITREKVLNDKLKK